MFFSFIETSFFLIFSFFLLILKSLSWFFFLSLSSLKLLSLSFYFYFHEKLFLDVLLFSSFIKISWFIFFCCNSCSFLMFLQQGKSDVVVQHKAELIFEMTQLQICSVRRLYKKRILFAALVGSKRLNSKLDKFCGRLLRTSKITYAGTCYWRLNEILRRRI